MIPADGIAVEAMNLYVDESAMTGESDMIEKFADIAGGNVSFMLSGYVHSSSHVSLGCN